MITIPDIKILPNANKSDIINQLSRKNDIRNFIGHITKNSYHQEELHQEIFLCLLEMDENKLIRLYETEKLNAYISTTLNEMYKNKNSTFFKKIRRPENDAVTIEFEALKDFLELVLNKKEIKTERKHILMEQLEIAISKIELADRKILEDYMKLGFSIKKVSQKYKIHISSISQTIQATKKELKKNVLEQIKLIEDQKI